MSVIQTTSERTIQWLDTPQRYGIVSRLLHWTMAAMILWQFASLLLYRGFGEVAAIKAVLDSAPSHGHVGFFILAVLLVRGGWGLSNARRRASHGTSMAGRLATAGHLVLYALMFLIPAVALLRSYGSGRGFALGNLQIIPSTGERVDWMVSIAGLTHGEMAWVMLALIGGHIVMAIVHHAVLKDDTLRRMAG